MQTLSRRDDDGRGGARGGSKLQSQLKHMSHDKKKCEREITHARRRCGVCEIVRGK